MGVELFVVCHESKTGFLFGKSWRSDELPGAYNGPEVREDIENAEGLSRSVRALKQWAAEQSGPLEWHNDLGWYPDTGGWDALPFDDSDYTWSDASDYPDYLRVIDDPSLSRMVGVKEER